MYQMKIREVLNMMNPFSARSNDSHRTEASKRREEAERLLATAKAKQAVFEDMLSQQKTMSDALRTEQRKNHFSEMFQQVPTRSKEG